MDRASRSRPWLTPAAALASPLHDRHVAAGAKFAAFGGWSMPLEYAGAECSPSTPPSARRSGSSTSATSARQRVAGDGAAEFVNRCLTNDLGKIEPGQAQYTLICNDDGGVVDDLIAYLRSPDEVFLIPNAANCAEVVDCWRQRPRQGVERDQRAHDYAILAVQGTCSDEVLTAAGFPAGHDYMSFLERRARRWALTVCRTGYTGERGYELVVPAAGGRRRGVGRCLTPVSRTACNRPASAARDTLRTEMGYPLHGQDMSPDITPVQARLGWAVGWTKEAFFGDDGAARSREARGPTPTAAWPDGRRPRHPAPGHGGPRHDGEEIGSVTSGTFSPTLKTGIALALLAAEVTAGDGVFVDIRSRREPFVITKPPFVTPGVREP